MGAPDIERSLGTSHAAFALLLFVVPGLIALVCEPVLFLLADRHPRHWFIRGGVGAMAIGAAICSAAVGPIVFAIGITIAWIATGTATGLAQATLVDRSPDERGKTLARWTLWSLAGDAVAPALLAGLAFAGGSWRGAFAIVAVVLAAVFVLLCASPLQNIAGPPGRPSDDDDDSGEPASASGEASTASLWSRLRDALSDKLLIAWLFGCALCDLLDEILLVFASIHVRRTLGASQVEQSLVIGAFMAGAALGLVVVERLLRVRSERSLLVVFSLATIVAFLPWVLSPSVAGALVLAIPVGFASAPLYPLAAAQAYATRPQQSGAVLAASHLFTPLGLLLPWLVGIVADHAGTTAAMALLVAQPLGLVVLVIASRARSS